MSTVFISTGETSGEILAAKLVSAMRNKNPSLNITAMGSKLLQDDNVEIIVDNSKIGIVGALNIITALPKFYKIYRHLKNYFKTQRPALVILIDFSGFHLRIAKLAKRYGIKVMYYVSPQIWATRPGRIKTIKKYVDHMAVLYEFEKALYERANIPVTFVGHPLIETAKPGLTKSEIYQRFKLDPAKPIIALLPGSRNQELKYLLPVIRQSVISIKQQHPDAQFALLLAPKFLADQVDLPTDVQIIQNHNYDIMSVANVAITASGTATLELSLFKVPMVIIYKLDALSGPLALLISKVKYLGFCNIIAGKLVCKEFLQNNLKAKAITEEINELLTNTHYHDNMQSELGALRPRLYVGDAAEKAANVANTLLNAT